MPARGTSPLPLLLLLLSGAARLGSARDLPPYLKACSESDPKLNECALKNGRAALPFLVKGDPSIKLLPADPQHITEIVIDQKGLKFSLKDIELLGQTKTVVQDIRIFPAEGKMEMDFFFPVLDFNFKYNVSGKILVLPLDGAGTGTMRLDNVTARYKISYQKFLKDNVEYIKVNVYEAKGEVGNLSINLQNLFNGDKFLGENTNKVLNENWKELQEELGPAMFESYRAIAQNLVDTITKDVPYRKFFLE